MYAFLTFFLSLLRVASGCRVAVCLLNVSLDLILSPPTFVFQLISYTHLCSLYSVTDSSAKCSEQCCSNVVLTSRCRVVSFTVDGF